MINVWDYQDIDGEVRVELTDGRYFTGIISSIDDEEDSGFGEDGISIETLRGEYIGLRQGEIARITPLGRNNSN